MKRTLWLVTAFFWLGSGGQVFGVQETPPAPKEKVEVMEEMTVTATKTPRFLTEVPASVTVITKKQIEENPARNLDEILREQAGIDLTRRNGMAIGIPERLDVRGVPGPNRTLVLVDGYTLNGSGTGFVSFQSIPLDSIERVEIVRGPFSALYGANALGGVINIITKRGKGKPDIAVLGGGGTYSWYQGGVTSGGGGKAGNYYVYGDTRRTHNYYFSGYELEERFNRATNQSTIDGIPSVNRHYNDTRYIGNFTLNPNDTVSITWNTRYFYSNSGLGLTSNLNPDLDETNQGETFFSGVTIKSTPSDRLSFMVRGYFRQFDDRLMSETSYLQTINIPGFTIRRGPFLPPIVVPSRSFNVPAYALGLLKQSYTDYQVEGQASVIVGKNQTITGGVDFLGANAQFNPIVNADTFAAIPGSGGDDQGITTFGAYIQDEIQLGKWRIVPGVRLDKHNLFDAVVSPKLGILYQLTPSTVLRTSGGRAYRAPSLTELYRPEWNLNPFIRLRPNRGLSPEYIWAVDAGIEHRFGPKLKASLDGFYNYMENFIITSAVAGSPGIVQYENLTSSWSAGFETAVEWRPLDWLTVFGNYTFLQSRDKINQVPITNLPDNKFNVGVGFNKKWRDWRFYGSVIETFAGEQNVQPLGSTDFTTMKAYAITSLAAYASFKEIATVGVTVQNLFDKKYMEAYGYLGPGRLVTGYAMLRYKF
ncbi:MAG: TonB-dependent receptor [Desulfobaccales bacterium]